jgi:hypothetical protein
MPAPLSSLPVLRAVILGASNLKRGLPVLCSALCGAAPGPVEVLAACGHGRSYVGWSRIGWGVRALPGIAPGSAGCGLWRALEARPPLPTVALLTDVGNDLLYGPSVDEILGAVARCLLRLQELGATVVCTPLPMVSLEKLTPLRYHTVRTILYPGRGEPWPSLLARARELDARLRGLAGRHGMPVIEPQAAWYGIDPIHVRRGLRRQAWEQVLAQWPLRSPAPVPEPGVLKAGRLRLPLLGAEELRLFGVRRHREQPACRLADGSTVAFY